MWTAFVIAIALILVLAHRLGEQDRMIRILAIRQQHLEEINAALHARCVSPEAAISDHTDRVTAEQFAVLCGYIAALERYELRDDPRHRAEAQQTALEYFRRHVGGHIASVNH